MNAILSPVFAETQGPEPAEQNFAQALQFLDPTTDFVVKDLGLQDSGGWITGRANDIDKVDIAAAKAGDLTDIAAYIVDRALASGSKMILLGEWHDRPSAPLAVAIGQELKKRGKKAIECQERDARLNPIMNELASSVDWGAPESEQKMQILNFSESHRKEIKDIIADREAIFYSKPEIKSHTSVNNISKYLSELHASEDLFYDTLYLDSDIHTKKEFIKINDDSRNHEMFGNIDTHGRDYVSDPDAIFVFRGGALHVKNKPTRALFTQRGSNDDSYDTLTSIAKSNGMKTYTVRVVSDKRDEDISRLYHANADGELEMGFFKKLAFITRILVQMNKFDYKLNLGTSITAETFQDYDTVVKI